MGLIDNAIAQSETDLETNLTAYRVLLADNANSGGTGGTGDTDGPADAEELLNLMSALGLTQTEVEADIEVHSKAVALATVAGGLVTAQTARANALSALTSFKTTFTGTSAQLSTLAGLRATLEKARGVEYACLAAQRDLAVLTANNQRAL